MTDKKHNLGNQFALGSPGNTTAKSNLPRDPETGKCLPGPGKPPGMTSISANLPKVFYQALAVSFDKVGSEEFLVKLAKENPKAYAQLLGRLLPSIVTTIDKEGEAAPLSINIKFQKPE